MGATNSPAVLSASLASILQEKYTGKGRHANMPAYFVFAFNYLDDIAVSSANEEEALEHYRWLFTKLAERGFSINAAKTRLFAKSIPLLGMIIDENGIHPDPKKVEAIKNMAKPTDRKGIKRVLGLAGYYRQFCSENFAIRAAPLNKLLKLDQDWEWKDEQEEAFQFLTSFLADHILLSFPSYSQPFVVSVDASAPHLRDLDSDSGGEYDGAGTLAEYHVAELG